MADDRALLPVSGSQDQWAEFKKMYPEMLEGNSVFLGGILWVLSGLNEVALSLEGFSMVSGQ